MTTKDFIEVAVSGGWESQELNIARMWQSDVDIQVNGFGAVQFRISGDVIASYCRVEQILIDPLAWAAVAKVKGWKPAGEPSMCEGCETIGVGTGNHMKSCLIKNRHSGDARQSQHRFIDFLQDGLSIEDAVNKSTV